jgi:hypothetical protein
MADNQQRWIYCKQTKTIRDEPGNHWIASMNSWDGAPDHDANAQLIASAPELLEAAKLYLAGYNTDNPLHWFEQGEKARLKLQSAIDKAECLNL